MPALDPEVSLGWLVHDVARLLRKAFEQQARAETLGVTRSQAAVLSHLARNQGINQAALAQLLEIEPITLVRLLDRLEDAGMVERRFDPRDRRAHSLHLTTAAWPMLERIRALGARVIEDALAGAPDAQRAIFRDVLTTMKGNLLTLDDGERERAANA